MGGAEVEIERRFLIDGRGPRPWVEVNEGTVRMAQVYLDRAGLHVDVAGGRLLHSGAVLVEGVPKDRLQRIAAFEGWAVRLRMENDGAVLTLKGPRSGASAAEHEFPIEPAWHKKHLRDLTLPPLRKSGTSGVVPTGTCGKSTNLRGPWQA